MSIRFGIRNTQSDSNRADSMSDADNTEIAEIAVDTDGCWHVDSREITRPIADIGTFQRPENGYQRRHVFYSPP